MSATRIKFPPLVDAAKKAAAHPITFEELAKARRGSGPPRQPRNALLAVTDLHDRSGIHQCIGIVNSMLMFSRLRYGDLIGFVVDNIYAIYDGPIAATSEAAALRAGKTE